MICALESRIAGVDPDEDSATVMCWASGDVFGRIYEYFLAEFSKQGAHDNGEFFTPPSIVQTIVNVIEPDHGIVLDPAVGAVLMSLSTVIVAVNAMTLRLRKG